MRGRRLPRLSRVALPPPVPNRPCARRDLGNGKKYATQAEYDAAVEAWRLADQSEDRRAMRPVRMCKIVELIVPTIAQANH